MNLPFAYDKEELFKSINGQLKEDQRIQII